jgi:hypothetical protein
MREENAEDVMDRPEVVAVIDRIERIEFLKDMGAPPASCGTSGSTCGGLRSRRVGG